MEKHIASFQEILEKKKREGKYREMDAQDTLVNPQGFKESMRKAREEFEYKSARSTRLLRDKLLK